MEQRADSAATNHEGEDGVYASALAKIHESNLVPAVLNGKVQTHPHLYDRLVSAGIEPDYPRPPVPSRWPAFIGAALFLIPALVLQTILAQLIGKWMDLDC